MNVTKYNTYSSDEWQYNTTQHNTKQWEATIKQIADINEQCTNTVDEQHKADKKHEQHNPTLQYKHSPSQHKKNSGKAALHTQ